MGNGFLDNEVYAKLVTAVDTTTQENLVRIESTLEEINKRYHDLKK